MIDSRNRGPLGGDRDGSPGPLSLSRRRFVPRVSPWGARRASRGIGIPPSWDADVDEDAAGAGTEVAGLARVGSALGAEKDLFEVVESLYDLDFSVANS